MPNFDRSIRKSLTLRKIRFVGDLLTALAPHTTVLNVIAMAAEQSHLPATEGQVPTTADAAGEVAPEMQLIRVPCDEGEDSDEGEEDDGDYEELDDAAAEIRVQELMARLDQGDAPSIFPPAGF